MAMWLISVMARNGEHVSSDNPPENIVRLPPVSPLITRKLLSSRALGLRFHAQVQRINKGVRHNVFTPK